jgi:hypothetical protein
LPVALEIDEAEAALVENTEEARRPAAVLDIGLAVPARRGEKEAVARGDEGREIRRDPVAAGIDGLEIAVAGAGAEAALGLLDRRGEGEAGEPRFTI